MDFKSLCIYKNCMDTNRRFTLSFHPLLMKKKKKKILSQNRVKTLNTEHQKVSS